MEVTNRRDTVLLDHIVMIDDDLGGIVRHGCELLGEEDLPVPVGVVSFDRAVGSSCVVSEAIREQSRVDLHVLGRIQNLGPDRVEPRGRRAREVNRTLLARGQVTGLTQAVGPIGAVLRVVVRVGEGESSYKRADDV